MPPEPATPPVNLTAIAERLPRPEGPSRTVRVFGGRAANGPVFEVQARDGAGDWPEEPGERDAVYVVISGEGALRCGVKVVECAAGDVLFAPAGAPRRFERLSDCLAGQALFHVRPSRRRALRTVRSLRIAATMAALAGVPRSRRRV